MDIESDTGSTTFPIQLFDECGIILIEEIGEFGILPPWATRRKTPRVFGWELPGGLIRIAHRYPPIQRGKETVYGSLLHWSFRADYVKAALTRWDEILVAVDVPAARLGAEGLDVLCQALFTLEKVPLKEFVGADPLRGYAIVLGEAATAAVAGDEETDWPRLTDQFSRVGFSVWEQDGRHGFRTFVDGYELIGVVNWSFGRIQVIGQLPDLRIDTASAFTRLLQLNHEAEVATCGLDHEGILRLLYVTPVLTDDMPAHLAGQFSALVPEVRAAARASRRTRGATEP